MKKDIKIILSILILIILSFVIRYFSMQESTGNTLYVKISREKDTIGIYPINTNREITVGSNIISIENNQVFMKEAPCPDNSCIRQGSISTIGQSIVCLPEKITCEIISGSNQEYTEETAFAIGTVINIKIYGIHGDYGKSLLSDCLTMINKYNRIFSTTEDSELYRLNQGSSAQNKDGYTVVSHELYELLSLSKEFSIKSQGYFNPAIGAITSLWNFTDENEELVPEKNRIIPLLENIDMANLVLKKEDDNCYVKLNNGIKLDLGAVAKGYIGNKIKEYLLEKGISRAIINLGGDTVCIGENVVVGIQKPFSKTGDISTSIKVSNSSIVTSGIYERSFFVGDKLYHHLINPFTGYPFETDLVSVTVVTQDMTYGDFYATYLFSMNAATAFEYAKDNNLTVVLIDQDGNILSTADNNQ